MLHYGSSLLDNALNCLVGCVIQKRCMISASFELMSRVQKSHITSGQKKCNYFFQIRISIYTYITELSCIFFHVKKHLTSTKDACEKWWIVQFTISRVNNVPDIGGKPSLRKSSRNILQTLHTPLRKIKQTNSSQQ